MLQLHTTPSGVEPGQGAVVALFDDAYRRRARLALLTASGDTPRWQHQGLKASSALSPWLDALRAAARHVRSAQQAGEWLASGKTLSGRAAAGSRPMAGSQLPVLPHSLREVLIDIEKGPIRGRARNWRPAWG
nr:magnesium chelatase [Pseudomonas amygdali]